MQSLTWYVRRLQAMSMDELAWRVRSALRNATDRYLIALKLYPSALPEFAGDESTEAQPTFRLSDVRIGAWALLTATASEVKWRQRLKEQADQIAAHRLSFFDLRDHHLGDPIDWNRDHEVGKATPTGFAQAIDYRDYRVTGDAKVVWEPNRHHQLVILSRAYRASGELRYAMAMVEQLDSWLQQCAFGTGMNWRSPLELAIRLINWVWAIDLMRESGLWSGAFRSRMLHSIHLHLWEITRKYSRGSSANNHRVGEAAGVFIATSYFRELPNARQQREESREILCQEILAQTWADGCNCEQALGYHIFVLQFFLFAGIVARHGGEDFPRIYWSTLEKMLEFVGTLRAGGDTLPMFGDADDGYVLDLGEPRGDVSGLLAVGALLFHRTDFKRWAGGYPELARWLMGQSSHAQFEGIPSQPARTMLTSRAFAESGYYLLQCGGERDADSLSVVFDSGDLGFGPIAAHGHADALSFSLRAFGSDVFVDPGTYDYFRFPAWREYFRGTRAHNTIVVDDTDQSEMLGSFLWGRRAKARCTLWEPKEQGGKIKAEHDGYTHLPDPVVHRRTLEVDAASRVVTIQDEIQMHEQHDIALYFHLSEDCAVTDLGNNLYEISVRGGTLLFEVDSRLSVRQVTGSEEPLGGWVSRGYHQKVPSTTLIARIVCQGGTLLVCNLTVTSSRPQRF